MNNEHFLMRTYSKIMRKSTVHTKTLRHLKKKQFNNTGTKKNNRYSIQLKTKYIFLLKRHFSNSERQRRRRGTHALYGILPVTEFEPRRSTLAGYLIFTQKKLSAQLILQNKYSLSIINYF